MNFPTQQVRLSLPLLPIVYILLIIAKIVGSISLGWFWVLTSIIWIPVIAIAVVIIGAIFIGILAAIFS